VLSLNALQPSFSSPLFQDSAHGADLFALRKLGPIYTRIMNPTSHVLEYRIAKLEGSKCDLDGGHPSALATASGQAAQMHTIFTICSKGDNFVAASNLYGGTYAQMAHTFPVRSLLCLSRTNTSAAQPFFFSRLDLSA